MSAAQRVKLLMHDGFLVHGSRIAPGIHHRSVRTDALDTREGRATTSHHKDVSSVHVILYTRVSASACDGATFVFVTKVCSKYLFCVVLFFTQAQLKADLQVQMRYL